MKIRVLPFRRLSTEHLQAWSEIQLASREYDSPYFRSEFHQLAAGVGRPVFVGVMQQGDQPVGFFPFERGSFGTAQPVGLRLSDFHGAIVQPNIAWSGPELLRACGVRRFLFDHLPTTQAPFITGPVTIEPSRIVDLSHGFDAYRQELVARGDKEFERTLKKQQKQERELGETEFRLHDTRPEALEACFAWKILQYERTGALNVFRSEWVLDLLRRIAVSDSPHFAGSVSTLSVAGEIVAVHVGMRTASTAHHWFPTHNTEHACVKYSPGLQLLTGMIAGLADTGVRRFDFGKGDFHYKQNFGNALVEVAEGMCGGGAVQRAVARSMKDAKRVLRKAAESGGLDTPVRWYRNMRDWLVMR